MFSRNPHNPSPKYLEKDITICLHAGSDSKVVENQMQKI